MGPVAVGRAGPRLLSEEEEETEPLRAETALVAPGGPEVPEDTHCDCLHAARVACRADLSGKAPSKYHRHPNTSILTTKEEEKHKNSERVVVNDKNNSTTEREKNGKTIGEIAPCGS